MSENRTIPVAAYSVAVSGGAVLALAVLSPPTILGNVILLLLSNVLAVVGIGCGVVAIRNGRHTWHCYWAIAVNAAVLALGCIFWRVIPSGYGP